MQGPRTYFKQRWPLLALCAALGLGANQCREPALSSDLDGITLALQQRFGLQVDELVWEDSRGSLVDWWVGRPFVVAARQEQAASNEQSAHQEQSDTTPPRDIYRVLARVSPDGRVLDIDAPKNLSKTPGGDEHKLQRVGDHIVFVSEGAGSGAEPQRPAGSASPPSLSLLGMRASTHDSGLSVFDRVQIAISNWVETGTMNGVARVDIIAREPSDSLTLRHSSEETTLLARIDGEPQNLRLSDDARSLVTLADPAASETFGSAPQSAVSPGTAPATRVQVIARHKTAIPWLHFGANLARSWWGTETVGRWESQLFSARDRMHRLLYGRSTSGTHAASAQGSPSPRPIAPSTTTPPAPWPPQAIETSNSKYPNDGKWSAWTSPVVAQPGEALFYRTVLHTDPRRPYAELHLVLFDMRRLELGMRAGYEDPEPDNGPPGSGHLPEAELKSVVATFNGAFKSTHGRYGMKAEGRTLVAPVDGAATVRVDASGAVGMGTHRPTDDLSTAIAFRQNLDALVEAGQVNPSGRTTWGEHVDATGVAIERSALCLHESGHLIYAWATEATGLSLAHGLQQAGCVYAIHLDMNPGHCAFMLNRVESLEPPIAQADVLDPRMKVSATRYVRWSPKDFFYLTRRSSPLDTALASANSAQGGDAVNWTKAPGLAPTPAFLPGLLSGQQAIGPITIELDRVEPGRLRFSVSAGTMESKKQLNQAPPSGPVLIAWGLGHQTYGARPGLSLGKYSIVPQHRRYATLVLHHEGAPALLAPGEALAESKDYDLVQFPVLARDGQLLSEARELGGVRPRKAMCITPSGALIVGRLEHDTVAPLAQALVEQGCSLVVDMDRGSHSPPFVERQGTDHPPQMGHAQSTLYGIDMAMSPRTYAY